MTRCMQGTAHTKAKQEEGLEPLRMHGAGPCFSCRGLGSTPGWGTRIQPAEQQSQKKEEERARRKCRKASPEDTPGKQGGPTASAA